MELRIRNGLPGDARVILNSRDPRILLKDFVEASRGAALSPSRFFSSLPKGGGYMAPLTFALSWGLFAFAIGGFWNFVVPGDPSAAYFVASLAISPFVTMAHLALVAAVVHLLYVRRSLGAGSAGFGATFKVCCYASVANILCAIPWVGFWVAGVWYFFLLLIGTGRIHFEKATLVREDIGGATIVGGWVIFAVLKALLIVIPFAFLVGVILIGSPFGWSEAEGNAMLAIVSPGAGAAYDPPPVEAAHGR
jgi:hypothetical protein